MVHKSDAPATNGYAAGSGQETKANKRVTTTYLSPGRSFVVATALSLAWQLALVVIVPIVGGYMLDQHYHKAPLLTLGGLLVAVIGVFGVLGKLASENRRGGV